MTRLQTGDPVRLLCDEMLLRLGRWLRAAGYDTAIAENGAADAALIARCVVEGRVLVTRDRHLAEIAEGTVPVQHLAEDSTDAQARILRDTLGIDWQNAPFTRCVLDNTPLVTAPPEATAQVPPASRSAASPLLCCPACSRLYWPGGHVRRMQARLQRFAAS